MAIQVRRDTITNWTMANPVLLQGELGLILDTGEIRVGDGSTPFLSLESIRGSSSIVEQDESDPEAPVGSSGDIWYAPDTQNSYYYLTGVGWVQLTSSTASFPTSPVIEGDAQINGDLNVDGYLNINRSGTFSQIWVASDVLGSLVFKKDPNVSVAYIQVSPDGTYIMRSAVDPLEGYTFFSYDPLTNQVTFPDVDVSITSGFIDGGGAA